MRSKRTKDDDARLAKKKKYKCIRQKSGVEEFEQKITHPLKQRKAQMYKKAEKTQIDNLLAQTIRNGGWRVSDVVGMLGGKIGGNNVKKGYQKVKRPATYMTDKDLYYLSELLEIPAPIMRSIFYDSQIINSARMEGIRLAQRQKETIKKNGEAAEERKRINSKKDNW